MGDDSPPLPRARPGQAARSTGEFSNGTSGENYSGINTEAVKPSDLARVVIDTTVQPKAVMFPTDAKLINRARERLVRLANQWGVDLRQSYRRVGKLALIKHQRYAHARQFKRANKALRKLKPISAG